MDLTNLNEFTQYQGGTKLTILKILKFCETEKDFNTLKQEMQTFPAIDDSFYSIVEILALVRDLGGLSSRIDADSRVEFWITIELGREFLSLHGVSKERNLLFSNNPNLQSLFKDMLKYLGAAAQVAEINDKFGERPEILSENVTVYFCIHELEKSGAIFWTDKGWKTSQEWIADFQ